MCYEIGLVEIGACSAVTIDIPLGRLELSFPVYRLGGLLWAKLIHNRATPIVVTWPIRQHHFTSESFICIILLLLDRVKVARSNFTTGHVI